MSHNKRQVKQETICGKIEILVAKDGTFATHHTRLRAIITHCRVKFQVQLPKRSYTIVTSLNDTLNDFDPNSGRHTVAILHVR